MFCWCWFSSHVARTQRTPTYEELIRARDLGGEDNPLFVKKDKTKYQIGFEPTLGPRRRRGIEVTTPWVVTTPPSQGVPPPYAVNTQPPVSADQRAADIARKLRAKEAEVEAQREALKLQAQRRQAANEEAMKASLEAIVNQHRARSRASEERAKAVSEEQHEKYLSFQLQKPPSRKVEPRKYLQTVDFAPRAEPKRSTRVKEELLVAQLRRAEDAKRDAQRFVPMPPTTVTSRPDYLATAAAETERLRRVHEERVRQQQEAHEKRLQEVSEKQVAENEARRVEAARLSERESARAEVALRERLLQSAKSRQEPVKRTPRNNVPGLLDEE